MRFSEFKIVKEAPEQNQYYTIGDSHAVTVAKMGGKNWVNLAIGGRSSTDSEMLANISKIPKGAVVLVSQGANDTANALLSFAQSQGKKPIKSPQRIASDVANVVNKVEAQGAKVVFMLFPNGPGRGAKGAQYYGGDFQDEVRAAIKSVLSVPIIDINGKPLTDGIHATMGTYKEVANEVVSKYGNGVTLGPTNAQPAKTPTKDKKGQGASPSAFTIEVPAGRVGTAVADVQKALVALGYPLPRHGVDGIRGPETKAAIKKFQRDNSLTVDGDPGPETVGKLNDILKSKPEIASKLTNSTPAEVKSKVPDRELGNYQGDSSQGLGETGNAKEAVEYFKSKGWTDAQAAGIVGNLQAESGANLKINSVGDGGQAYGIAQWHPDRQEKFKRAFGKDIRESTFKEQLAFVQWELENSEKNAAAYLKKATTPEQAAWAVDEYYERSNGAHRQRRINNALALADKQARVA